ncbi:MAG: c-type cytochrome [Bdellovibrionales bacterium]|nr:c-type cytochrome [Bdellovibrionales bacterium]
MRYGLQKGVVTILILVTLLIGFQNCGNGFEMVEKTVGSPGAMDLGSADLKSQALIIMEKNCVSCHAGSNASGTGFSFADDLNKIAASRYVVPGNPNSSLIYQRIALGNMPPLAMLPSDQQRVIADWIMSLPTSTPSPTPVMTPTPAPTATPTPKQTPTPTPTATPSMATYSYLYNSFLSTCAGCHGNAGGYTLKTYNDFLKIIVKGNANQSLLYGVVSDGRMPQGRVVSDQDKKALYDWIQAGALNN